MSVAWIVINRCFTTRGYSSVNVPPEERDMSSSPDRSSQAKKVTFARAKALQDMLVAFGTGGSGDSDAYQKARGDLLADANLRPLTPPWIAKCRDLDQFWAFIKSVSGKWAPRRHFIWNEFVPLLDALERGGAAPADSFIAEALAGFDADGVHAVWVKALDRRASDPEGAITSARTLLETVCKRILDDAGKAYTDTEDLPKLYAMVAECISLSPAQHSEPVFRAILGSCQNIVNSLGSLRNKIGDAHGKGGKPVKPSPRHAQLAVNLAGTMATFLVETWLTRKGGA
jgi:hypothetical protein